MLITVHLAPRAARAMSAGLESAPTDLSKTVAELGLDLKPLHPGVTDPDLAAQFYATVDDDAAEEICARLLENSAVVAAYSKPAGQPPGGPP
jgi:hypothetical protein